MKLSEIINKNATNIDVSKWPEGNSLWITVRNYAANKSIQMCIEDTNELGCIHLKTNPLIGWESPSYAYIPNTIIKNYNEIKETMYKDFTEWLEIIIFQNGEIILNTNKEEVNDVILDIIKQQEQFKINNFSPIKF